MAGIVRSFISTGCLQLHNLNDEIVSFTPYVRNSICGTMQIVPYGIRDYSLDLNGPQNDENQEVIYAMNAFLDYDSDDENAMNAILGL